MNKICPSLRAEFALPSVYLGWDGPASARWFRVLFSSLTWIEKQLFFFFLTTVTLY